MDGMNNSNGAGSVQLVRLWAIFQIPVSSVPYCSTQNGHIRWKGRRVSHGHGLYICYDCSTCVLYSGVVHTVGRHRIVMYMIWSGTDIVFTWIMTSRIKCPNYTSSLRCYEIVQSAKYIKVLNLNGTTKVSGRNPSNSMLFFSFLGIEKVKIYSMS